MSIHYNKRRRVSSQHSMQNNMVQDKMVHDNRMCFSGKKTKSDSTKSLKIKLTLFHHSTVARKRCPELATLPVIIT